MDKRSLTAIGAGAVLVGLFLVFFVQVVLGIIVLLAGGALAIWAAANLNGVSVPTSGQEGTTKATSDNSEARAESILANVRMYMRQVDTIRAELPRSGAIGKVVIANVLATIQEAVRQLNEDGPTTGKALRLEKHTLRLLEVVNTYQDLATGKISSNDSRPQELMREIEERALPSFETWFVQFTHNMDETKLADVELDTKFLTRVNETIQ